MFDGRKSSPYVESDAPNPLSAYGSKAHGEAAAGGESWIVRSSRLFGPTGRNFVRTMLHLGRERDEVAVVDDQRGSPTYVGHLAEATTEIVTLPHGIYHAAAAGDCTWAEFAEAIFEEAGLDCRVGRITAAELRPAGRRGPPTPCCGPTNRRRRCCRMAAGTSRMPRQSRVADYRFLTTWVVDAPIERVWDVIYAISRWPEWWRGVEQVRELFHGEGNGEDDLRAHLALEDPVRGRVHGHRRPRRGRT